MAKSKSIFEITGKVGNIVIYKVDGQLRVRSAKSDEKKEKRKEAGHDADTIENIIFSGSKTITGDFRSAL